MARRASRRRHKAQDFSRPLRVILLGRVGRRSSGGIGRSAKMIVTALERFDARVRLRNVREPLTDIPSDTDLVWHYGDYDLVQDQAQACREAGVPMLVNSTHDNTADRRRWMIDLAERTGAYLVVFAHAARDDVRLRKLRDRLVVVPKTIRAGSEAEPPPFFSEREGIAIGELEKLRRARLVRGLDIDETVATLRKALPDVKLYAYDQYATAGTTAPEGVEVVAPGDDMLTWLGLRRLYVSLTVHETFSMVPAEAQAVATPVLYRPMPQALSEQLGQTALAFETPEQLAMQAQLVYGDQQRWGALSYASYHNAEARAIDSAHVALDMALRKVVMGS